MVQILNKAAHPLDLSVQILAFGLLLSQIFLGLSEVILESLLFVLDQGQLLLEVDDLELGFVLEILVFESLVLTFVERGGELGDLLTSLRDVLFKSGIVALDSFKFLLEAQDLV